MKKRILVTREVFDETIAFLQDHFEATLESRSIREEEVYFPLPKELRQAASVRG